jgi:aquaporin Z
MNGASALRHHWPEYLMEACGLGLFMVSAGIFGTLLEYAGSPLRQSIESDLLRRGLMGLAMGATAVALIYSPWGKQSGAHYNPAVTLAFLRLGKIGRWDALFYTMAQFLGGLGGVILVEFILGQRFTASPVSFVSTRPGDFGVGTAFIAEVAIAALLMGVVLHVSNTPRLELHTGLFAGGLVALYITIEAPISGMSLNPARSFASAAPAAMWEHLWIYFVAPPLGMLAAAQIYLRVAGRSRIHCAKLHHQNSRRCIFCAPQVQLGVVRATHKIKSEGIAVVSGVIH